MVINEMIIKMQGKKERKVKIEWKYFFPFSVAFPSVLHKINVEAR